MKKSLIALAALATVATAAQAQSSVTVYGILDAGVRVDTNAAGNGLSKTWFGDGVLATNRLGFKGSEDLGGGRKANFNLETGIFIATGVSSQGAVAATSTTATQGNVFFDRFAWVGVSDSNLGEVQLGRNTNAGVHNIGLINAHGAEFEGNSSTIGSSTTTGNLRVNQVLSIVGNTTVLGTTRSDGQVKYLKSFGNTNVIATYGIGGQAGDSDKRKSYSLGANTTISNVTLAAAVFETENDSAKKLKYVSLGGNVALGAVKLFAGYNKIEQDAGYTRTNLVTTNTWSATGSSVAGLGSATNGVEGRVYNVGVQYAWNATNTTALSYFDGQYEKTQGATGTGDYKSYTFTHKYAFSKRTTGYVSFDQGKKTGALNLSSYTDNKNTGYGVGVIHSF